MPAVRPAFPGKGQGGGGRRKKLSYGVSDGKGGELQPEHGSRAELNKMMGWADANDPRLYRSPGGYVGLVKTAVATGDLSILSPLSVRDAIWIDIERGLKRRQELEYEQSKIDFMSRRLDDLYLALLDNREVARSTNYFSQIAALKEAKHPKFTYFEVENLPSFIAEKQRKKDELVKEKKAIQEKPEEIRKKIQKQDDDEQSALVKKMWMHMKRIEAAEKQFGSAYNKPVRDNNDGKTVQNEK